MMLYQIAKGEAYVQEVRQGISTVLSLTKKEVRRLAHLISLTSTYSQNLAKPLDGQTILPFGQVSYQSKC